MPELPEVETVVTDLRPVLVGQVFSGIETEYSPALVPGIKNFKEIIGYQVSKIERRGKYINIFLENKSSKKTQENQKDEISKSETKVMTIHLRMTGRLIVQKHDDPKLKYERTRIDFENLSIRFCDLRKFGKVYLFDQEDYQERTGVHKLGIEPLTEEFNFARFLNLVKGNQKSKESSAKKSLSKESSEIKLNKRPQTGAVKKFLLDQSKIAGIGNIYADEACFYSGIRPDSEISKLSKTQLEKLHQAVIIALKQGIRNRGTSVKDFEDAYGKSGKNQELLYVYGRGGEPCIKCENPLKKIRLVGRGTVYCENCQS